MTLKEYQDAAMTTCTNSSNNFAYMMLNLVGEVEEFASKVAKLIRKEKCCIDGNDYNRLQLRTEWSFTEEELKKEAGDILWQLSGLCSVMGWSLEEIAQMNLDKLADRQKRNVIVGEGDNR